MLTGIVVRLMTRARVAAVENEGVTPEQLESAATVWPRRPSDARRPGQPVPIDGRGSWRGLRGCSSATPAVGGQTYLWCGFHRPGRRIVREPSASSCLFSVHTRREVRLRPHPRPGRGRAEIVLAPAPWDAGNRTDPRSDC